MVGTTAVMGAALASSARRSASRPATTVMSRNRSATSPSTRFTSAGFAPATLAREARPSGVCVTAWMPWLILLMKRMLASSLGNSRAMCSIVMRTKLFRRTPPM